MTNNPSKDELPDDFSEESVNMWNILANTTEEKIVARMRELDHEKAVWEEQVRLKENVLFHYNLRLKRVKKDREIYQAVYDKYVKSGA